MKRGDVCWALLEPRSGAEQRGRRPVVVVSHDSFNQVEGWRSVIVVPLTTSRRQGLRGPTVVALAAGDTGLPQDSVALGHQVTTLDRTKLEEAVAHLDRSSMDALGRAIAATCDL
jgi:mRNA interferase MazF